MYEDKTIKEAWEHLSSTKYTEDYTDKGSLHNYLNTYDDLFGKFRDKEISMLEIGAWKGYSLNLWWHCFPKADITGTDIRTDIWHEGTADTDERVHLVKCNSTDKQDMDNNFKGRKFDIIIDDGGHEPHEQIETFNNAIDLLAEGGVYVVEDVYVAKFDLYIRDYNKNNEKSISFPKDLFDYEGKGLTCKQVDLRNVEGRFDDFLIVFKKRR